MEKRNAKIMFAKPGGTASKGSVTSRISLPITWIREMGITENDREVLLKFNGKEIIIEKE